MIQYNYNIPTKTINIDAKDSILFSIKPLIEFKSQQTGKSLLFLPFFVNTINIERYNEIMTS